MHLSVSRPPTVIRRQADLRKLPAWKRAIDIICCLVVLPFLALGALAVGVMSMLFSPGPIFFRQERIGYRGRRFMIYKFRTMHLASDTQTHSAHFTELIRSGVPMQKLDGRGDRRLVPGGWLLRASGLDELPQIINVLRGEMSLVGPRPCIPYEFELYTAEQRRRFDCVPGLTGLWQVSGKNRTTFNEMVRFDIEYAETRSLGLDLRIMVMTVPALITQIVDTRLAKRKAQTTFGAPVPASTTAVADRSS
ncbi:MAG: sugar transferase [Opitutaceae bacterium]|nr:sugar transferase [Opitutaceae bacterium]